MNPSELYSMDLTCLGEWILAVQKAELDELDNDMQKLAWQTALLMNSTGNFKKKIKPSDLYTPMADVNSKPENKVEDKKKLQEELLEAFAGIR